MTIYRQISVKIIWRNYNFNICFGDPTSIISLVIIRSKLNCKFITTNEWFVGNVKIFHWIIIFLKLCFHVFASFFTFYDSIHTKFVKFTLMPMFAAQADYGKLALKLNEKILFGVIEIITIRILNKFRYFSLFLLHVYGIFHGFYK